MGEPVIELELYLARHGESRSNAGIGDQTDVRGWEDPPLSEKGERQARLLGEFYARMEFDCILSSGLDRAIQTAGEVALRQKRVNTVEIHPAFTENGTSERFGVKTMAEIREKYPFAVPAFGTDPAGSFVYTETDPPDERRLERGHEALTYLRRRFHSGEKVFLAAHANFNTFFILAALGQPVFPGFDVAFMNTGVTKFIFYAPGTGRWGEDTHIIWHNSCAHLANDFPDAILTAW